MSVGQVLRRSLLGSSSWNIAAFGNERGAPGVKTFLPCPLRNYATQKIPEPEPKVGDDVTVELLTEARQGIGILSLNRPSARNALSKNLVHLFTQFIEAQAKNADLRVLVIRSTVAGVFCAGADLKERAKMTDAEVDPFVATLRRMTADLVKFPVPTIAALDGAALGGGLEMALACDIRIASSSAKMGLVETTLGIIPGAGGTQYLPRLIGVSNAKELIFTGTAFDGHQAKDLGVVNEVVEQNANGDAAFQRSLALADRINSNGPVAVRMAKMAINHGIERSLEEGLLMEQKFYAQITPTQDRREGLLAFKEKRKPKFIGK
ncbi:hypothetical protein RvY_06817 [Ramazzottius varieornatus]|uniref:Enoyl-CoA hydratase n=1 Tax=Ramazzottius varieornatus TaxID=947166 RepID=A0A1D1V560_RAMVA|nr:hypothetical protein RvY_06817 [Ramazzottius varieornatus]